MSWRVSTRLWREVDLDRQLLMAALTGGPNGSGGRGHTRGGGATLNGDVTNCILPIVAVYTSLFKRAKCVIRFALLYISKVVVMKYCTQILFLTIISTAVLCFYFLDIIVVRAKPHPAMIQKKKQEAHVLSLKYEMHLKNLIRRDNLSDLYI